MMHIETFLSNRYNKIKIIFSLFLFFVVLISLPGCRTSRQVIPDTNLGLHLQSKSVGIDSQTVIIGESNSKIKDSSESIIKKSDSIINSDNIENAKEFAVSIRSDASGVIDLSQRINDSNNIIKTHSKNIFESGDKINEIEKSILDLQQEESKKAKENLYTMLSTMFAAGGLIIVGGIVLAFFNPKLGIYISTFGLILTTIATAGTFYLQWVAIIGCVILGVGLLLTAGFLAYSFWQARVYKDTAILNVKLIDSMKEDMTDEIEEKYFSDDGLASHLQTEQVRKQVKQIRENSKLPK